MKGGGWATPLLPTEQPSSCCRLVRLCTLCPIDTSSGGAPPVWLAPSPRPHPRCFLPLAGPLPPPPKGNDTPPPPRCPAANPPPLPAPPITGCQRPVPPPRQHPAPAAAAAGRRRRLTAVHDGRQLSSLHLHHLQLHCRRRRGLLWARPGPGARRHGARRRRWRRERRGRWRRVRAAAGAAHRPAGGGQRVHRHGAAAGG